MDRFTRNYSIALGIVILALIALFMYEDPQLAELNELLVKDTRLTTYPYRFRVLRLENRTATMTTPRSADFPAYRALGLLFPSLAGLPQDDDRLMRGQLEMARIQEHAMNIVLESDQVGHVIWELDTNWLERHGAYVEPAPY